MILDGKLYAKASLELAEIEEKIHCGCDGIEYNLTDDFIIHGANFEKNYDNRIFTMKNVEVVHVPYYSNHQLMNLERIFQHEDLSPVDNVFSLAQYCANVWGHRVLVVIHCSLSYYDFLEYELFRKHLVKSLDFFFSKYSDVDMAIENVIPLEYYPDFGKSPFLCNGTFSDTADIVVWLQKHFGERVGSVLDTCHALMTEKYMNLLLGAADFLPYENRPAHIDYKIDRYFQMNQSICKLIHLNDFIDNGYQQNHGTVFQTQEKLNMILNLYQKYNYNCPLTLEIREDDYTNCVNYRKLKRMIEHWEKLHIECSQ